MHDTYKKLAKANAGGLQVLNLWQSHLLMDFFKRKPVKYNVRVKDLVQLPYTRTLRYGNDSLAFRGSILWNTLPDKIESANSISQFKNSIEDWTGSKCNCVICS